MLVFGYPTGIAMNIGVVEGLLAKFHVNVFIV